MRDRAHIIGLIIGILVTPLVVLLGILSFFAEHGDHLFDKIFFPLTMTSTLLMSGSITMPFILLAIFQYPIYGWVIGSALRPNHKMLGLWLVLALHLSALILYFVIQNPSFGR
jgi:hypothetical protein